MCAVSPAKYVYIASRGYSGSTLLEALLDNHPRITAMGEIEKFSLQLARQEGRGQYPGRCSCGRHPVDCERWSHVISAIKSRFDVDFAATPYEWRVSDIGPEEDFGWRSPVSFFSHLVSRRIRIAAYGGNRLAKRLANNYRRWATNRAFVGDVIREYCNTDSVVDASKDAIGMRDMYGVDPSTTRILFLTRDVRAVTWSGIKRDSGHGRLAEVASTWVRVNRLIIKLLEDVPRDHWMHIRYEDICSDVEGSLTRICRFIGHNFDPSRLNLTSHDIHTIGGNAIRYEPINEVRENIDWQKGLSSAEVAAIGRMAGDLCDKLGYHILKC